MGVKEYNISRWVMDYSMHCDPIGAGLMLDGTMSIEYVGSEKDEEEFKIGLSIRGRGEVSFLQRCKRDFACSSSILSKIKEFVGYDLYMFSKNSPVKELMDMYIEIKRGNG